MEHPRTLLDPALVEEIRRYAFVAEAAGRLPAALLDIIYRQGWFQLMVPRSCGGQETDLPSSVRLFEALAWAEANTGWCVNLGAGANMFAGYFEESTARSLFHSEKTCCAGSGAVSGKARRAEGGYILSGRWKYASGANHATHFTANAWLLDEQGAQITEEGQAIFRSFIVPAAQVSNLGNWRAIGLCATSSNDFEAIDVFVPDHHVFNLQQASAFADGPLYRFPFGQLAVVDMACMLTGIALHFIDLYEALAAIKKPMHSDHLLRDDPKAQVIAGHAIGTFLAKRAEMYKTLDEVWALYAAGQEAGNMQLQQCDEQARAAAFAARTTIHELYPLCGMSILDPATELNKVWRDAMTAGQHYLLSPLYS